MSTIPLYTHRYIGFEKLVLGLNLCFLMVTHDCTSIGRLKPPTPLPLLRAVSKGSCMCVYATVYDMSFV